MTCGATYRKNEAVLKVGELFVALLAAEHAVLLVHHFFVAVLAGAGLVEAVLLTQVHYGCYAGVVICLKGEIRKNVKGFLCWNMLTVERPEVKQHEVCIKMTVEGAYRCLRNSQS